MSADDAGRSPEDADKELVASFKRTGESEYFAEIFRRHKRSIFGLCWRFVKDSQVSEDLAQEAFEKAYRNINSFKGEAFAGWLFAIARNLCLNYLKSRGQRREVSDIGLQEIVESHQSDLELSLEVESVLNLLPLHQRALVKLFFIDGYTYEEIAKKTGFNEHEVKTHLQNGKRNFRNYWKAGKRKRHE